MAQKTRQLRVVILLLAVLMGALIVFGEFSIKGSGFSVGYSYFDVFKNTDNRFLAGGVWALRLGLGAMVLAAALALFKAPALNLAGGVVSGGWFIYNTITRLTTAAKYGFFESTPDFIMYFLPAIACLLCLLLFRRVKAAGDENA